MISESLKKFFKCREVRVGSGASIAYNHLCFAIKNRLDQFRYLVARILIISVSIDDDICAEHETMHDAMMKSSSQTTISLELNDMMDTELTSYFYSPVCTSIVDDEIFYLYSGERLGEVVKCYWQGLFFVFTGDLDDEFYHNLERVIIIAVILCEYHHAHERYENSDTESDKVGHSPDNRYFSKYRPHASIGEETYQEKCKNIGER